MANLVGTNVKGNLRIVDSNGNVLASFTSSGNIDAKEIASSSVNGITSKKIVISSATSDSPLTQGTIDLESGNITASNKISAKYLSAEDPLTPHTINSNYKIAADSIYVGTVEDNVKVYKNINDTFISGISSAPYSGILVLSNPNGTSTNVDIKYIPGAGRLQTTANYANIEAGATSNPVYFSDGIPVACDQAFAYNLEASSLNQGRIEYNDKDNLSTKKNIELRDLGTSGQPTFLTVTATSSFNGHLIGNADSASALTTKNVGSAENPVYINVDGVPAVSDVGFVYDLLDTSDTLVQGEIAYNKYNSTAGEPTTSLKYLLNLTTDGTPTFSGLTITNDIHVGGYLYINSDRRLKNIHSYPSTLSSLNVVNQTPVCNFSYTYNVDDNLLGIIAQDLETSLINNDFDSTLFVSKKTDCVLEDRRELKESKLVYLLWGAIQEQQKEIEALKKEIEKIKE